MKANKLITSILDLSDRMKNESDLKVCYTYMGGTWPYSIALEHGIKITTSGNKAYFFNHSLRFTALEKNVFYLNDAEDVKYLKKCMREITKELNNN